MVNRAAASEVAISSIDAITELLESLFDACSSSGVLEVKSKNLSRRQWARHQSKELRPLNIRRS